MFNPSNKSLGENKGELPPNAQQIYNTREFEILSELYVPDDYLLDLGLFKDFRVGAFNVLLHKLSTEEGRKYHQVFMDNLLLYQDRKFEEICTYVPGCPFTEDDVEAILQDEKEHYEIFCRSPITHVFTALTHQIYLNMNNSLVGEKWEVKKEENQTKLVPDPIYFHINIYPLKLSKTMIDWLGNWFAETYHVRVKIIYIPPAQYTKEQFMNYDDMWVKWVGDIMECEWYADKPVPLDGIHNRYITSRPVWPREFKIYYDDRMARMMSDIVQMSMMLHADVSYLNPRQYALDPSLFGEEEDSWLKTNTNQTPSPSPE